MPQKQTKPGQNDIRNNLHQYGFDLGLFFCFVNSFYFFFITNDLHVFLLVTNIRE